MNETFFWSIMATGFVVAFSHAAIPTHWLPFVLAGRGQRWSTAKTLLVTGLCGLGHVLFTTLLGVLLVWLGIETSKWFGTVFPWIAGGALILFGLYYLFQQWRGDGHGHSHFGSDGHSHGDHDHSGHDHGADAKRIDTGHGVLALEVFEDGVPPRFRLRADDNIARLPQPNSVLLETVRSDGTKQNFSFVLRKGFLESVEEIPEPHEFAANINISHGDHGHPHTVRFEERGHGEESQSEKMAAEANAAPAKSKKSDWAVFVSLFTLLTFSPCEGFLPVYLSGISYGWMGFIILSLVLAAATIAGMLIFTALTMSGMQRLNLAFLEKYEAGILGALIMFLGIGIIWLGF